MSRYAPKVLDEKKMPANLKPFLQFFNQVASVASPAHLQRTFSRACAATLAADLKESAATPSDQCRYTALSVTGALSFLNASIDDPSTHVADAHLESHARITLGLECHPDLAKYPHARCVCGFLLRDDPVNHFFACKLAVGEFNIKRHDGLNKTNQQLASDVGVGFVHERILDNKKRLDGDYIIPQFAEVVGTDWSVVHPACFSFQGSKARTTPGYAAQYRANSKTTKYDAQVRKQGGVFLPLVVETFGGFHSNVNKLLLKFRKTAELTGHPIIPSVASMRNRLSAALIRGNAAMIANGVARMARNG